MSAILDALRRARGAAPPRTSTPAPPRPAGIPAGLLVGAASRPVAAGKGVAGRGETRWGVIAGVIVAAVAVWAGVHVGLPLLQPRLSAPRVVAVTNRQPPAATPAATAPPTTPAAQPPAPAAPADPGLGGTPSLPAVLDDVIAPPAVAPRAMPGARTPAPAGPAAPPEPPADVTARAPRPPAAGRSSTSGPIRQPVPVTPAPAVAAAAVAPPPAPGVNHFDLAVRYQSLGNFEQALAHYSAVLHAQEFNIEARNNLGLLYMDRGLITEAIDQFKRAILINPEYLKARGNLAVALMNAGRLDEARAELRAALAIAPRNPDLLVNMALVEKTARQPEQAKEMLMRALGYQPTHAAAHYNLAVLYDESGDTAKAYDQYNDFLENAGPEYGARLSDVRRRLDAIAPTLGAVR